MLYPSALDRRYGDSMAWHNGCRTASCVPSCGQPNVGDPCPAIMTTASQAEYPHTFRMIPSVMCKDRSLDYSGCLPLQLHNLLLPDLCESCIIQLFLKACGCLNLKQSHSTGTLREIGILTPLIIILYIILLLLSLIHGLLYPHLKSQDVYSFQQYDVHIFLRVKLDKG